MLIQPQFETYRYTGEIDCLHSQSMVECRLPGSEIGSVLAIQATAAPTECVCTDGEVRYGGKLLLCVVYEDGNKKICRIERGAEFFHKAEGSAVTPACFAKVAFTVENITHRREGSGLYISVVVGACANVYGGKQIEYLTGGENVVVKTANIGVCKTVCVSGEAEAEDEFETDYVGDILLHSENAVVTRVGASAGVLNVDGELSLNVCVLKSDESVCAYERLLPFSLEIPCEEAFGNVRASARVCVKSAQLTAGVDEEKGKSKIVFSYVLSADCFLSCIEEVSVAQDAFSPLAQMRLEREKGEGRYLTNTVKCTERIGGVAALSALPEGEYTLEAAVLPHAETVCKKTERGAEVEGAALAEVLLRGADGGRKSCTLSLPFVFPVDIDGEAFEADCIVCGLNVRRKNGGETEAEATLKVCVKAYERCAWEYIRETEEGEALEESDAAVSIFVPRAGETLWEVAKRLSRTPEELQRSNPDLEFPVKDGERIFVYRQIK
ncbi:MAG: DUF3794 domain-containing protein [Clostridia bacterium]|nr:DUF3794 domain-containing protein [Clostridia bacterium]